MRHFRPLSLGEIFDGGITVFVRAGRRTAIVLATAASIEEIATLPFFLPGGALQTAAYVVLGSVLAAVALVAYAMLLHIYACEARGIACTLRQALHRARERFWHLVAALAVASVPAACVQAAASGAAFAALGLLFSRHPGSRAGYFIPVLSFVALIVAAVFLLTVFATLATFVSVTASATVAEYVPLRPALGRAWRRCFSRRKFCRRTIAVGAAWSGPFFAVVLASDSLLDLFPVAGTFTPLAQVVAQSPAFALGTAWTSVLSLDAAVRLEAFDLFAEAETIASA